MLSQHFQASQPAKRNVLGAPHLPAEPVRGQSRSACPFNQSASSPLAPRSPTPLVRSIALSTCQSEIVPLDEHGSMYEKLTNDAGNGAKCEMGKPSGTNQL